LVEFKKTILENEKLEHKLATIDGIAETPVDKAPETPVDEVK
jgi:hypothetical protein